MTAWPTAITSGVTTGMVARDRYLNAFLDGGAKYVDAVADNSTNNTLAITDAMDAANFGDTLILPPGPGRIRVDPFTITKALTLLSPGRGKFATRLVPTSDSASALVTFDITEDSGEGIYGNYGPRLEGVAIDRLAHMSGPCIRTGPSAAWLELSGVLCSGGTRSIEHHAPNATFEDVFLWDPSDAMIDMDEDGLELHMRHVVMAANVTALNRYIRVTIVSGGGLKGAIYGDDVTGNAVASVGTGMSIIAPSATEVPIFLSKIVLDNVDGGGPVVDLVNVQTVSLTDGWLNGSHGCVRMDGCLNPRFRDLRTRGGTHSFEFVGATTQGFTSECEVFTGPAYKISTTNKPTLIDVDDDIAGATDIGQVTNDPAWLEGASRRTWGSRRFMGTIRHREAGTAPPSGYAVLTAGLATVTHPLVATNTRVRISRERVGAGAPGEIFCSVADNIAGTSFKIRSTSAADNGAVYWEFVGNGE